MSPKKTQKQIEARRLQKREAERRRRERIKSDPNAYLAAKEKERKRYHERKQQGKIKLINQLSERKKRDQRKRWRVSSAKYRDSLRRSKTIETFVDENTPPSTPRILETPTASPNQPSTSRRICGRKRVKRNRSVTYRKFKKAEEKLEKMKRMCLKYKKKYYRLKNNVESKKAKSDSPRSKVSSMLDNTTVSHKVRRKLQFGEALSAQLAENYRNMRSYKAKTNFRKLISGKILKKYRCQNFILKITGTPLKSKVKEAQKSFRVYEELKKQVRDFLEKDSSSRLAAGKKETVTNKKIKKQKRYLCDSLKNVYTKFRDENSRVKLSYATFCKLRPFWIVIPRVSMRETCLCTTHENMRLLVSKLKLLGIINQSDPNALMKIICCQPLNQKCLERSCKECSNKGLQIKEFDGNEHTSYKKWVTKRERVEIKGKEKICVKNIKEEVQCKKLYLVESLINDLDKYMQHEANIRNQYNAMEYLKGNLRKTEVIIHADFSENYNCKYYREIQSAHFGGSKSQITLHTVVWYYKSPDDHLVSCSYCSLSENLRHDPVAIMAHLEKLLIHIKGRIPDLKRVHFLSDGPCTQYRNKSMFFMFAVHISKILQVSEMSWNFSESGHGKGAPDGVGGCLKRTADRLVAQGNDISDLNSLRDHLRINCPNIMLEVVDTASIQSWNIIPNNIPPFRGTLQIHQITWTIKNALIINARRLSCFECPFSSVCSHFHLGEITIQKKLAYGDIYSDSSDEEHVCLQQSNAPQQGDYIIAEWPKFSKVHYVGQILSKTEDSLKVKFMRKLPSTKSNNIFIWPETTDVDIVDWNSIEAPSRVKEKSLSV